MQAVGSLLAGHPDVQEIGVTGQIHGIVYLKYRAQGGQCGRLIGSGNGLRMSVHPQKVFEAAFHQPLSLSICQEEAAVGAAIKAASNQKSKKPAPTFLWKSGPVFASLCAKTDLKINLKTFCTRQKYTLKRRVQRQNPAFIHRRMHYHFQIILRCDHTAAK